MQHKHEDKKWQAIARRDKDYDGIFFYGVLTTGIVCIPSCPSRRPNKENIQYFNAYPDAEKAGYRPCKRCHPHQYDQIPEYVKRIRAVAQHIQSNFDAKLKLGDLAQQFSISPAHLQKAFTEEYGISPKEYQNALRLNALKTALKDGDTISAAVYDAGFGSISRAYEQIDHRIGMTFAAYQSGGKDETITYGVRETSFGLLLMAATRRGICFVQFGDNEDDLLTQLQQEFPRADFTVSKAQESDELSNWMNALNDYLSGSKSRPELPLDINGTAFQMRVWKFLMSIPDGEVRSYTDVAKGIKKPRAIRAVASACASNTIAILIPCHRVLRSNGTMGGYRWGTDRKVALLEKEKIVNGV